MSMGTDTQCNRFVCCCFTSYQHLRSHQDGYLLMTMHTRDDFIVLPHWEARLLAPWPDIPLSHIILTDSASPCPILIMPSAWLWSDKYQFESHWFYTLDQGSIPQGSDLQISQNGSGHSTHSAIPYGPDSHEYEVSPQSLSILLLVNLWEV